MNKQENNAIKKDPVIARALELSNNDQVAAEKLIDKMIEMLRTDVSDKNLDPKIGFIALARTLGYFSQSICYDEEDFKRYSEKANELVATNVFQGLGVNAENDELNKSSIVTYNGDYNKDNFSIKTLMLISSSIVTYTFWRLNYNKALTESIEE